MAQRTAKESQNLSQISHKYKIRCARSVSLIKSESFQFRHRFYFNQALHLETHFIIHCSQQRTVITLSVLEFGVTMHGAQHCFFFYLFCFLIQIFTQIIVLFCFVLFCVLHLLRIPFQTIVFVQQRHQLFDSHQIMFNLGDFILFLSSLCICFFL